MQGSCSGDVDCHHGKSIQLVKKSVSLHQGWLQLAASRIVQASARSELPHIPVDPRFHVSTCLDRCRVRPGAIIAVHDRWHTAETLRKALPRILKSGRLDRELRPSTRGVHARRSPWFWEDVWEETGDGTVMIACGAYGGWMGLCVRRMGLQGSWSLSSRLKAQHRDLNAACYVVQSFAKL